MKSKYLNLKIIFILLLITIVLSLIIPSGQISDGELYHVIKPQLNLSILEVIGVGFVGNEVVSGAFSLVFLIISILLFMNVVNYLKIFDSVIYYLTSKNINIKYVTILFSLFFIFGATTHGMYETTIAFFPVMLLYYKSYNISSIYAMQVLLYSLSVGHIGSLINPFMTTVAYESTSVDQVDSFTIRLILLLILIVITIAVLLYDLAKQNIQVNVKENQQVNIRFINLLIVNVTFLIMIINFMPIGFSNLNFYQIGAIFVIAGFILGYINKQNTDQTIDIMLSNMKQIFLVTFVIGFSRSIYVVLNYFIVIDVIVYSLSDVLVGLDTSVIVIITSIFFLIIGFFISSSSALALITIPILAPVFVNLGISEHVLVLIYQLTLGVLKIFSVTSPIVLSICLLGNVNYVDWFKKSIKFAVLIYFIGLSYIVIVGNML